MNDLAKKARQSVGVVDAVLVEMADEIERLRLVLDEVAYGVTWGGSQEDHITFMRSIAYDVLEHGKTDKVPQPLENAKDTP